MCPFRRPSPFVATSLLLLAAACETGRDPVAELRQQRDSTLRAVITRFHASSKFPGAVAGAWFTDSTTIAVGVGLADRDLNQAMPDTALLHAGSVGKTFWAALILQLVGEGRLGLDDSLRKHLGGEPWYAGLPNGDAITVRMLLEHTSGLPEFGGAFMGALIKEPGVERSPLDGVKSVLGEKPKFPAGSGFGYTDVNYQLLQLLAEKVTASSGYAEIQRRILDPLRLTRVVPADRAVVPGLVNGYAGAGSFLGFDALLEDGALVFNPVFEGGGGGFITNAGDMARWTALFTEGKAFPASLLLDFRRGVPAGQMDVGKDARSGLGIEIVETPLGTAYGHGGFFPGYLSLVLWYPDAGVSVALQVNSSADGALSRPMREVLLEAAEALKGISAKPGT
jgi:D-alanyl-D-alanine carboxypeptidase